MEIAIGVGIGVVIAVLFGSRRKRHNKTMPYEPSLANTPEEIADERKIRETDELITVVLPTINKDE